MYIFSNTGNNLYSEFQQRCNAIFALPKNGLLSTDTSIGIGIYQLQLKSIPIRTGLSNHALQQRIQLFVVLEMAYRRRSLSHLIGMSGGVINTLYINGWLLLLLLIPLQYCTNAYSITTGNNQNYKTCNNHYRCNRMARNIEESTSVTLHAVKVKQSRSNTKAKDRAVTNNDDDDDDEKPAGIVGAQFFGGNKEKEIFYDPIAEKEAGLTLRMDDDNVVDMSYHRFTDPMAFPDAIAASVAESIQDQINHVLFADETTRTVTPVTYTYAPDVKWETPFPRSTISTTTTPLLELESALDFYRRLNVAVVCGKTVVESSSSSLQASSTTNTMVELRWEISVLWPTVWEPRVVVTGVSTLVICENQITQQTDVLDDSDLFGTIRKQFFPRFWDVYHIGMTPAAETLPTIPKQKRNIFSNYGTYEIPPRIMVQPTQTDSDREDCNASIVPNHAFTCIIKTMGPEKQFYTPVNGVQVRLMPNTNNNGNRNGELQIQWNVPIATEYISNPILQLPRNGIYDDDDDGNDDETEFESVDHNVPPQCRYAFVQRYQGRICTENRRRYESSTILL
jgi:hypothetical protein